MEIEKGNQKKWLEIGLWYILPGILLCLLIFPPVFSYASDYPSSSEYSYTKGVDPELPDTIYPERSLISFSGNENISAYAQGGDGLSWASAYIFEDFSITSVNRSCISIANTSAFIIMQNIQIFSFSPVWYTNALYLLNCENVRIENATFYSQMNFHNNGITLHNCTRISTAGSILVVNFRYAIDIWQSSDISIGNLISLNNQRSECTYSNNILFTECYFEGNYQYISNSLSFREISQNLTVSKCVFNKTLGAIWVSSSEGIRIIENYFVDTNRDRTGTLYFTSDSNIIIHSNYFGKTVDRGFTLQQNIITFYNPTNVSIKENLFEQNCEYVFAFGDYTDVSIIKLQQNTARRGPKTWSDIGFNSINFQLVGLNRFSPSIDWWMYTIGFSFVAIGVFLQILNFVPKSFSALKMSSYLFVYPQGKKKKKIRNELLIDDIEKYQNFAPFLGRVLLSLSILIPLSRSVIYNPFNYHSASDPFNTKRAIAKFIIALLWIGGLLIIYFPLFKKNKKKKTIPYQILTSFRKADKINIRFLLYSCVLWVISAYFTIIYSYTWFWVYPLLFMYFLRNFWAFFHPPGMIWQIEPPIRKKISFRISTVLGLIVTYLVVFILPLSSLLSLEYRWMHDLIDSGFFVWVRLIIGFAMFWVIVVQTRKISRFRINSEMKEKQKIEIIKEEKGKPPI